MAYPCLIFSPDGILSDEYSVVGTGDGLESMKATETVFLRSLYDDKPAFLSFCSGENNEPYQLYRLRCFPSRRQFRFAFCERAIWNGNDLVFVYLGTKIVDFSPLMSSVPDAISSLGTAFMKDLVQAKSSADYGNTRVSTEAFHVISRVPCLTEALLKKDCSSLYCDVQRATTAVLSALIASPSFCAEILSQGENTASSESVVQIPLEAYTATLILVCNLFASLSLSHKITVDVRNYAYAIDVTLSTETDRLSENLRLSSLRALISSGISEDRVRIAELIAAIADIDLSLDFDKPSGLLKVTIGLGYEKQETPDFKYADPYEHIPAVVREILSLGL